MHGFVSRSPLAAWSRRLAGLFALFVREDVLLIDRSRPIDLSVLGDFKQPFEYGLVFDGIVEQDERALALKAVDLSKVRLATMRARREKHIDAVTRYERLKNSGLIRLDAQVFLVLWQNRERVPERFKRTMDGKTACIVFDGTLFRFRVGQSSLFHRLTLILFWSEGAWHWGFGRYGSGRGGAFPSAVLEP